MWRWLHARSSPIVSVGRAEGEQERRGGRVEDVPYNYMGGGPVFAAVNTDSIRGAERALGAGVGRKYRPL